MANWDKRFLDLAKQVASWSKDPSTKTGAVIVDPSRVVVSTGFNGLPQKIRDDPRKLDNRELKYKMIIHAEVNALIFAKRSVEHCTLYIWPFICCSNCASIIIQAGITTVVAPYILDEHKDRWEENLTLSRAMFHEAMVVIKDLS